MNRESSFLLTSAYMDLFLYLKITKRPRFLAVFYIIMTSQEGFEPPTARLEGVCSIQLSY